MSNADWLDNDPSPQPAPQFIQTIPSFEHSQPPANVVLYLVVLMLAIALGWSLCFRGSRSEPEDDESKVAVNKVHVMVIEESADRGELTPEQLAVFNSVQIRKDIVSRKGEMRVFDVNDDFETIGDPWQSLKQSSSLKPPYVVVAKNRKAVEFKLKDVETVLDKIESVDGAKR